MSMQVLDTDVLIVGSGAAGLCAAVRAKEAGVDVIVIEKAQSGFSGDSAYGAQHIPIAFPGDDIDQYAKQSILWSDYLADQDIVYAIVSESYDRFQDLLKWGVEFMRDDRGDIKTVISDKFHSTECKARYVFPSPPGGPQHIGKIKREALRLGARFVDRLMVTDVLIADGRVAGAVGFQARTGTFTEIKAKAVVIATGTFALGLPVVNGMKAGAAGMMMALRAGASLRNMEQGKSFGCSASPYFTSMGPYYWAESEWWGQKIVNSNGDEFMEQYELARRVPGRRHWPPPWRLFVPPIVREWREGRGPCYLDLSDCPNYWERMRDLYGGYLGQFVREWDYLAKVRGGLPLNEYRKERHELIPGGAAYEARGGIRVNTDSETGVPGLYAAGVATDSGGGAGYSAADSFVACFTQGHRAGVNAARYAQSQPQPVIDEEQVAMLQRAAYAPLERTDGIAPDELQSRLAVTSYRYLDIIKHGDRLEKGIDEVEKLISEARRLKARHHHELVKCHNTKSTVELWDIMARAALKRTESRADHYREDYPLMDNDEWLKWLVVRQTGDKIDISAEDIPFDKKGWKHKPEPGQFDQWRTT